MTIFTGKCPASNNACPSVTSAVGSFKPLHQKERLHTSSSNGKLVISIILSTVCASLVFLGEEQRKMLPSLLPICFIFSWYFSTPEFFWWLWLGTSCLKHNGSMFRHLLTLCTWWHLAASLLASHAFGNVYSLSWRWQILLPWQCGIVQSNWRGGGLTFLVLCSSTSFSGRMLTLAVCSSFERPDNLLVLSSCWSGGTDLILLWLQPMLGM